MRNHPHVVASYLGSTREVIERSGPTPVLDAPPEGGTSMTQTDDATAPQFKAADEQVAYEDLGWFRRILAQVHELVQRRAVVAVLGAAARARSAR